MADFEVKESPEFLNTKRKLETTDRAHANLFNDLYQSLFDNDNYLNEEVKRRIEQEGGDIANTKVSEFAAASGDFPVPEEGESSKTLWGKMKKFVEDFKNWNKGVCMIGQIVNNCTSDAANLPLAAKQGKELMGLYTQLNEELTSSMWLTFKGRPTYTGNIDILSGADAGTYWVDLANLTGTLPATEGYGIYEVIGFEPNTTCVHKFFMYSPNGVTSILIRMFVNERWYSWREYKDTTSGLDTKAPKNHAASQTTYGGGTSASYGHVKLSDNYTSSAGDAAHSIGASSTAVANAYANSFVRRGSFTGNIDNLRTATDNGTYWVDLSTITGDKPSGSGSAVLEVVNGGGTTVQKMYIHGATNASINRIAYRLYANNQWYPWQVQEDAQLQKITQRSTDGAISFSYDKSNGILGLYLNSSYIGHINVETR